MSYSKIQQGLDTTLAAVTGVPTIAWENVQFTPTIGTPFVRTKFFPNQPIAQTIGSNGYDRLRGLYQVDVFYPSGDGAADASAMAELIIAAFPRAAVINSGGVLISIDRSWRETSTEEPNWFRVPVVVAWRTYV